MPNPRYDEERLAFKPKPLPPMPVFPRLTQAVREADELFESGRTGGGGTRHWLRDCLLPALERHGLAVVDAGSPETRETEE